ncbi:UNVERIFIED_CONTAM: BSD domain-containing protein 1 [Siphonaria sp. JEL0065]|nr:BSD domain-containing protein 1 [Siphonaria sp. JEL0065]
MSEESQSTNNNSSASGWGWGSIPSWDSIVDTVKKQVGQYMLNECCVYKLNRNTQTDVVANVLERDITEFISVVAPSTNPSDSVEDLSMAELDIASNNHASQHVYEPTYDPDSGMILNVSSQTDYENVDPTNNNNDLLASTPDVVEETVAKIEALVDRAEDFIHQHVDVSNTVHKLVESVNSSETVHKIEEFADTAEDFLESVENGVWNFMSNAISMVPTNLGIGGGGAKAVVPKANIIFDRKTATILALRRDAATYTSDPSALPTSTSPSTSEKELSERYTAFKASFEISTFSAKIARLLDEDSEVRGLMTKIVPSSISYEEFWTRYFFRVQEVDREEEARKKLISNADLNEEEIGWSDESSEEEQDVAAVEIQEKKATEFKTSVKNALNDTTAMVLGRPVSITEAVEIVESNKPIVASSPHQVVEELRATSSVSSDRSSFDVVSDKPKEADSVSESEAVSVFEKEEESLVTAVTEEKKPKKKKEGDDEGEEEAVDWGTQDKKASSKSAKATPKDTKSKLNSVAKPKSDQTRTKNLKNKLKTDALIDNLDADLPDILSLASKMKVKKAVFGVLEKPRTTGPSKKQIELLKTEDDLDDALEKFGSL